MKPRRIPAIPARAVEIEGLFRGHSKRREPRNNDVLNVGVEWAAQQTQDLLDKGVPSVHFYVMQSAKAVSAVLAQLKK